MKPSRSPRQPKATRASKLVERHLHLVAAPPDEAGHQGAFTVPGDLLTPTDSSAEQPPLNSDTTRGRPIDRSNGVSLLIVSVVGLTALALFGVYLPW